MSRLKRSLAIAKKIWRPELEAKKLHEELVSQRESIKNLTKEVCKLQEWVSEYHGILTELTDSMKAMVWQKDNEHRYIIANRLHCNNFFGFSSVSSCLKEIKGKTDIELISSIYRDHNIVNTFGETCFISDRYTSEKDELCHFFEAGIVDGDTILLYVLKAVQKDDEGNFKGTIGIGWNFSDKSAFIMHQLNTWIRNGKVEELYKGDDVFCYALNPELRKCDVFKHVCPNPKPGVDCPVKDCYNCDKIQ